MAHHEHNLPDSDVVYRAARSFRVTDFHSFVQSNSSVSVIHRNAVLLGLSDWLEALPFGIHTQVGQRGSSLSAGERQLVALVRAFMVKPDMLVLDEATSSVDALTEVRISRALERLARGRTTISIAHRLSTASRADRVIMLENGRIVEDGPHSDLVATGGKYAKLFEQWLVSTGSGEVE